MSGFECWGRQWFALLVSGDLVPLGDHGDFDAADATAQSLGLETVWLADAETVTRWREIIDQVWRCA
jgi:hypothetical protein